MVTTPFPTLFRLFKLSENPHNVSKKISNLGALNTKPYLNPMRPIETKLVHKNDYKY